MARCGIIGLIGVTVLAAGTAAAGLHLTVAADPVLYPDADFTNIRDAVAACSGGPERDTITVYPGVYEGALTLVDHLTLEAAPGVVPTIRADAAGDFVVALPRNAVGITVAGFIIDGGGLASNGIVAWKPAPADTTHLTEVQLANNLISNVVNDGIYWHLAQGNLLRCVISNCTIRDIGGHGIFIHYDNGRLEDSRLTGNRIYDVGGRGIWIRRHNHTRPMGFGNTVAHNLIVNNGNDWGLYLLNHRMTQIDVRYNTIAGNASGVYINGVHSLSDFTGNIVWNNAVSDMEWLGGFSAFRSFNNAPGMAAADGNIHVDPSFLETVDAASADFYRPAAAGGGLPPFDGYTRLGFDGRPALDFGGCHVTTSLSLTLGLLAAAPGWSGTAARLRLSNNASDWYEAAFVPTLEWDLGAGVHGGDPSEGFKTVFYQPLDGAGQPLPGAAMVSHRIEFVGPVPTIAILPDAPAFVCLRDALAASTAGDVIEIQGSRTYHLAAPLMVENDRTLRARAGDRPTLRTLHPRPIIVTEYSPADIVLDGLVLDGNGVAEGGIVFPPLRGLNRIRIRRCTVRNVAGDGLYFYGDNAAINDAHIEYNRFDGNRRGIYLTRHSWDRGVTGPFVLRNNLFVGSIDDWGIEMRNWHRIEVHFENNTVAGNLHGIFFSSTNTASFINNSIVYHNTGTAFTLPAADPPAVTYSCFQGYAGAGSHGNIDADPLFVDLAAGDYHLKGRGGALVGGLTWVSFPVNSPCIDTGDPLSDYSNEPPNNGGRINMGAYGNTREASRYAYGSLVVFR